MENRTYHQILDDILINMDEMNEKGVFTQETTLEDIANYAGRHVLLTEENNDKHISN